MAVSENDCRAGILCENVIPNDMMPVLAISDRANLAGVAIATYYNSRIQSKARILTHPEHEEEPAV